MTDIPSLIATYLLPDWSHLISGVGIGLVGLACIGLGFLVGARRPAIALVAGWGICGLVTVALGTIASIPLDILAVGLGIAGLAGLVRAGVVGFEDRALVSEGRLFLLSIPLLLLVAAMSPSQYDEFSHWLPNLAYLSAYDHFSTAAVPNDLSDWPGYPSGLALPAYAVSLMTGQLAESGAIVWNALLLIAAGCTITRIMVLRLKAVGGGLDRRPIPWSLAIFGVLLGGLLSPSFVPKIALTNYGDNAATVVIAVILGLVLEAEFAEPAQRRRRLAVAGWCAAALVNIRQDSLVLFVLLIIGIALALLSRAIVDEERPRARDYLLLLPAPLVTTLLWRHYVSREMPGGDFSILPFSQWHWALMPATLREMGHVAMNKSGMFVLLLVVSATAIVALAMPRRFTPLQRFALVAGAAVALGNIAFLTFAYLAAGFADGEVRSAASFWRYATHGGQALVLAGIVLIPTKWLRDGRLSRPGVALLVLVTLSLPLATAKFLRFDLQAHTAYLRTAGREIATRDKDARQIVLIDENGDSSNLNQVRYQVLVADQIGRSKPPALDRFYNGIDPGAISAIGQADYVWVYEGTPDLSALTSLPLEGKTSYLLKRSAGGERIVYQQSFPASWISNKK